MSFSKYIYNIKDFAEALWYHCRGSALEELITKLPLYYMPEVWLIWT